MLEYEQIIQAAVRKTRPERYRFGNLDDEDYVQEARMAVWRHLEKGGDTKPALIYIVAKSACIDYYRKRHRYGNGHVVEKRPAVSQEVLAELIGWEPVANSIDPDLMMDIQTFCENWRCKKQVTLLEGYLLLGLPMGEAASRAGYKNAKVGYVMWSNVVKPGLCRWLHAYRDQG